MPSVFDLLEDIRKRPEMFVGMTSEDRGSQLRHIEMVLRGYGLAIDRHGIDEPGKDFLSAFDRYLREHRSWTAYSGIGAIAAVQKHATSGEEAWKLFWELVDEFRDSLT